METEVFHKATRWVGDYDDYWRSLCGLECPRCAQGPNETVTCKNCLRVIAKRTQHEVKQEK